MLDSSTETPTQGCRFYIVRHGHSEGNAQSILQGHKDYVLSAQGSKTAREKAAVFQPLGFHRVYSSDLKRASDTARFLVGEDQEVVEHKQLRERTFGQFEGRTVSSFVKLFQEQMAIRDRLRHHERFFFKLHPEIESDLEISTRMLSFIDQVAQELKTGKVLIVSHGGIIRATLIHLGFGKYHQLDHGAIENLGYFVLEHDGATRKVIHHSGIKKTE